MNLQDLDENVRHLYTRVVSCCISWMLQKESNLTRKLILEPLMKPFHDISKPEIGKLADSSYIASLLECKICLTKINVKCTSLSLNINPLYMIKQNDENSEF